MIARKSVNQECCLGGEVQHFVPHKSERNCNGHNFTLVDVRLNLGGGGGRGGGGDGLAEKIAHRKVNE